jgi:predicted HicB family RNase H-like nuclease
MTKTPIKSRKITYVLGVRVDPELKAQIEAAAAAREWSVSHWMARTAQDALAKAPRKSRRRTP